MEINTDTRAEITTSLHPFAELLECPRHRVAPDDGGDDDGVEIIVRVRFVDTEED